MAARLVLRRNLRAPQRSRGRGIQRCGPPAEGAGFRFVADRFGLSFWADTSMTKKLPFDVGEVVEPRMGLVRKGLVAYRYPLFQVLDLPRAYIPHFRFALARGFVTRHRASEYTAAGTPNSSRTCFWMSVSSGSKALRTFPSRTRIFRCRWPKSRKTCSAVGRRFALLLAFGQGGQKINRFSSSRFSCRTRPRRGGRSVRPLERIIRPGSTGDPGAQLRSSIRRPITSGTDQTGRSPPDAPPSPAGDNVRLVPLPRCRP